MPRVPVEIKSLLEKVPLKNSCRAVHSSSVPLKEAKLRREQFLPFEVVSEYELNPYSNERLHLKAHRQDGLPEVLAHVQGHRNERHGI